MRWASPRPSPTRHPGGPAPGGLLSEIFYPTRPGNAFVSNRYDTLGRVAAQTNANGATWSYFFAGYRSEEVDPRGTRHVLYYNPRGKAQFDIQDYDGLNLVTQMAYDGLDRLTRATLPLGYNAQGDLTKYTYDTTLNPWANNVASMERVPRQQTVGITTRYVYDPIVNKPIQITRPPPIPEPNPPPCLTCQITTLTYDPANGNVASIVPDSGRIAPRTRYTYSGLGQVASTTDPLGIVTTFAYDTAGNRLSMVEDAGPGRLNRTTAYGYNERGDVVSLTDPNGNVTRYDHDLLDRQVSEGDRPHAGAVAGDRAPNRGRWCFRQLHGPHPGIAMSRPCCRRNRLPCVNMPLASFIEPAAAGCCSLAVPRQLLSRG